MKVAPSSPVSDSAYQERRSPILLDARQAAESLAISPRKLWAMTASGQVPCVRLGRSVRYSVEGLTRFVSSLTEGGAL